MPYPIYATQEDLKEYLSIEKDVPDSQRLLKRASDFIHYLISRNFRPSSVKHKEAAKLATCAQVEYWLEAGESTAITGSFKSFSLGDLSMDYGDSNSTVSLSSRSQHYLNMEGLLYRGVSI